MDPYWLWLLGTFVGIAAGPFMSSSANAHARLVLKPQQQEIVKQSTILFGYMIVALFSFASASVLTETELLSVTTMAIVIREEDEDKNNNNNNNNEDNNGGETTTFLDSTTTAATPSLCSSHNNCTQELLTTVMNRQDNGFWILFLVAYVLLLGIYGTIAVCTMWKDSTLPRWTIFLSPPLLMILHQTIIAHWLLWLPLRSPGLSLFPFGLVAMYLMRHNTDDSNYSIIL